MAKLGMLILGLEVGKSIQISDDITLTLLGVYMMEGCLRAKIGIDAPRDVSVHRKEIWLRIQDCRKRNK